MENDTMYDDIDGLEEMLLDNVRPSLFTFEPTGLVLFPFIP